MKTRVLMTLLAGSAALVLGSTAVAHGSNYGRDGLSGSVTIVAGPHGPRVGGTLNFGNVVYVQPRPAHYVNAYYYRDCNHWHGRDFRPSKKHARHYAHGKGHGRKNHGRHNDRYDRHGRGH